jgi:anthranilate phosphoribosyltransferase
VSPAEVRRQVYGIYDVELTPRIASVLKEMGSVHAMVVHGAGGLDEISNLGKTRISELKNGKISTYYIEPKEFGLKTAKKSDLVGMGPDENAEIIMRILKGEKGPKRDIVVMNAGAAIYVGDRAKDLKEGIAKAQQSIDSGAALDKLQQLIKVSNAV